MHRERRFAVKFTDRLSSDSLGLLIRATLISAEQKDKVKKLVFDWADEGIQQGFGDGGLAHYISQSARWETIDNKDYFEAFIDLGTAGEAAIDELLNRLEATDMPIEKVYFGEDIIGIKEQKGLASE